MSQRLHRSWSCVAALCWALGCGPDAAVMAPDDTTGMLDDTSTSSSSSGPGAEDTGSADDTSDPVVCGPLPALLSPTWARIIDPDVMYGASRLQATSSGGAVLGGHASLIGLDAAGEPTFVQWHDEAFTPAALAVTASDDVLVAGREGEEAILLRYTELGEPLARITRPMSPAAVRPVDLVIDPAGGALLLSSSDAGAHLDRLDDDLQFGESAAIAYDSPTAAALQLDDTGIVLVGSFASDTVTLATFDTSGVEAWRTSIPAPGAAVLGGFLEVLSAKSDALYVIVRSSLLPEGQPLPRLLAFSDDGGGTPMFDHEITGRVLAPAPCDGVYVPDVAFLPDGDPPVVRLVHIDAFGSQTAEATLEVPTPPPDYAPASVDAIDVTAHGTIAVHGTFSSDEPDSATLAWVAAYVLPE